MRKGTNSTKKCYCSGNPSVKEFTNKKIKAKYLGKEDYSVTYCHDINENPKQVLKFEKKLCEDHSKERTRKMNSFAFVIEILLLPKEKYDAVSPVRTRVCNTKTEYKIFDSKNKPIFSKFLK